MSGSKNPDSERRRTNKNCRIWLQAEQTAVTLFYTNFRKLG